MAPRIDLELPGLPRVAGLRPVGTRSPKERPDARRQLPRRERLDEIVVGTNREADDPVDLLGAGREHDHVGIRERPGLPQDFEPVKPGQHDVEHHDVRGALPDHLEAGRAIAGLDHLHPGLLEVGSDELGEWHLVVDDQDPGGVHDPRTGSVTFAVVPPPARSTSSIVPPWASTIQWAIARPRPVPAGRISRARRPR